MTKQFVLVLCLSGLCLSIHAQGWREEFTQAEKFYKSKDYNQALLLGENSLNKYLEAGERAIENQIAILRLLSEVCYGKKQFAKGLEYLNTEIQLRGELDTAYTTALMRKARFQNQLGRHDLALTSLLKCHQILAKHHKSKNKKLLECDLHIAIEYYLNNNFEKANEWFKSSLHQAEEKNFFSVTTIEAAYFYGLFNLETNKKQEALKDFNNAIHWCETAQHTTTFEYALIRNGLATAHNFNYSFDEAEKSFQLAQTVCERAEENIVDYYNEILTSRAVNFQQLGKFFSAEMIMKKTLPHHESKLPNLPILDSALAYQASGDYERSEILYQKALGHYQSDDKESLMAYAEINHHLAIMYLEKGDLPAALTQLAESRELIEKLYGYYHQKYVHILNTMGFVYIRMESWVEAEASFRQAFQIMDRMLGKSEAQRMAALAGMIEVEKGKQNLVKADSVAAMAIKTKLAILKQIQLPGKTYP
jgi:hypothetical protein